MISYFLVYFLLITLCVLGNITKKNFFLILIFLILTFFSGFRYYVGVDYQNYVRIYERDFGYGSQELGFNLLMDFLRNIGGTYQLMFLIMAILMQVFVYKIIKRYNFSVWTSVAIYYCISTFYIASFNGTRQYLAIAMAIWALQYVEQRKVLKYVLSILFAAFFWHKSVLVFIPLYFLLSKKISLRGKLLALIVTVLSSRLLSVIISYTPYLIYLERTSEIQLSSFTYIFAGISLFLLVFWNKIRMFDHKEIMENMNLLCFLSLLIVVLQSNGILTQMMLRINSYFLFIYILLIPAIIAVIKNRHYRIFANFCLYIILFLYLFRTIYLNGESYELVPYSLNFNLFK